MSDMPQVTTVVHYGGNAENGAGDVNNGGARDDEGNVAIVPDVAGMPMMAVDQASLYHYEGGGQGDAGNAAILIVDAGDSLPAEDVSPGNAV